jgi:2-succinyl-6-hydroxy-2,4-cyclohexadiene-1-carboxylate synthase
MPSDIQLLAVDLTGHGQSADLGPGAYDIESVARSVVDTVGAQVEFPVDWLGYSMGGRVALFIATRFAECVSRLALIGTSPGLESPTERAQRVAADEALAAQLEGDALEAFVDSWMAQPLFASQAGLGAEYLAEARAQRLRNKPSALAATLREMGTGVMPSLWSELPDVAAPVLLIAGEADTKFQAIHAHMAELLPNGRTVVVPQSGHAVHVEAPADVAGALTDFLAH